MPTIRDVARVSKVSEATVSRVLNNYPYVKEETRKKVLLVMDELNYVPNELARGIKLKRTKTLGLFLADITNPFYAETAKSVCNTAEQFGYTIILCTTDNDPLIQKKHIHVLRQKQVDGFIFASVQLKEQSVENLIEIGQPCIFYNRRLSLKNTNYVVTDNEYCIFLAIEYLFGLGHRRIAFICGKRNFSTSQERFKGYKKALKEFQIKYDKELVVSGEYIDEEAYLSTKKLLNLSSPPTAIIAANDLMALSVINAVDDANLKIPQDISLVGIDDIKMAKHSSVQLTTIAQNSYQMAEIATRSLIKLVEGNNISEYVQVILRPKLIIRKTCAVK